MIARLSADFLFFLWFDWWRTFSDYLQNHFEDRSEG